MGPTDPDAANTSPRLPRILCLHGGGTSAMIFKIQTMKLASILRHHFHLVFVDAPFPCPAGREVLPVFEDCGPYYRWTPVKEGDDVARVRTVLRKALIEESDGMPFVGVLGFSQGGMLSAGILMEQFQSGGGLGGEDVKFKFGVFLVPGFPPISVDSRYTPLGEPYSYGGGDDDENYWDTIDVSSVHLQGKRDTVLSKSQALAKCFRDEGVDADGKEITKTVFEFDVGHHMPTTMEETRLLANAILKMHYGPDWKPQE